ncbi:MAG: hypothetical protein ACE5GW_09755, partial [Planctomycetota bacterium]
SSPGAYRSFSPLGAIREGRGRMARAMLQNLWDYARYFPYALGGCPLVLFIVGIVAARRRFRPGSLWMTCGVFAFYGLSFSLFYVSRRFWLPLMPLALPWCGAGGVAIAGACAALWGVRGRSTACALLLLTLAQSARPLGLKEGGWWTGPERRLGARLAERHGEGVVYSSAKGRVAWYARGRHLTLPNAPLADIAYFMERRGCRLLVVDRARLEKKRAMLWRELQRSARFREVDAEAGTGRDLRVYRLE